jgi:hypothetical protein
MDHRYGYDISKNPSKKSHIVYIRGDQADFVFNLNTSFRDVVSIELVKAIISNPDNDDYVVIHLDDLNITRTSDLSLFGNAFCTVDNNNLSFIYRRTFNDPAYTAFLDQARKISRLKIKLFRPDGSLLNYGLNDEFLIVLELVTS